MICSYRNFESIDELHISRFSNELTEVVDVDLHNNRSCRRTRLASQALLLAVRM